MRAKAWSYLGLLSLLIASTPALGKVEARTAGGRTELQLSVDGVRFETVSVAGQSFQAARLVGVPGYEAIEYKTGEPELPVIRFYATGTPIVQAGGQSFRALAGGIKLPPAQPARVKLPGQKDSLVLNKTAYARRTFATRPAYEITPAGSVNGQPRSLVTLYPFAYAPATGNYALTRSFHVTMDAEAPVQGPEKEIFAFVVGAKYKTSAALAAYETLKSQLGYLVERIDVTSEDTPDTIRAGLKRIYARSDAKLKYALIIGDAEDVPAHESETISGVTDHYYRAIDTDDYESDINGPDIGVGRVAVESEAQLAAVLGKYTRYLNGAFAKETWLEGAAFLATDDQYDVAEGTHNYVVDTYTKAQGYVGSFPAANEAGGDKLYAVTNHATSTDVLASMQAGRTIIDYSGHGSNDSWLGPEVTEDTVRKLKDPDALPFVIGNACVTGDFRVAESFGETWERHPNGAIVYWGSMDNTYWEEDDILERAMFDGIYQNGNRTFDQITTYAQSEFWRHYGGENKSKYYWETYVTFGDPSLELRTTHTRAVTLDGPSVLPMGAGSVTYLVHDARGPVAGARVAITAERGEFRLAGITDAAGQVTFDVANAAREPQALSIAVAGQNLPLTKGALNVIPAESPYLSLSDFTLNGRTDGSLYLGETAVLNLKVQNLGRRPTAGGTLSIAAVEGPATAVAAAAALPAAAAQGDFRVTGEDLQLQVAADAAAGATVTLQLQWTTAEGQTATVPVRFKILRAATAVAAVDFGKDGESGGIRPGASGNVYLTVTNTGNEPIHAGTLHAIAGRCVESIGGDVQISDLAPGTTARLAAPLTVAVQATCQNGDEVSFALAGSYGSVATEVALTGQTSFSAGVLSTLTKSADGLSLPIPDNGPAVAQELAIDTAGVVTDVGVHVRIQHDYIGDLVVKLVHPDGTEVVLYNRDGGSDAEGLDHTYGLGGTPLATLAAFAGKATAGTWKLVVQDLASRDAGTLTDVELTLKGYWN